MSDLFPLNSRYRGVALRSRLAADGTIETFVGRRIIPAIERFGVATRYKLGGDDRIDRIAAETFGDSEQYWKICDANGDADPAKAAEPPGRLLVIPLPLEIEDHGDA
jgi:hypothetical protein